MSQPGGKKGGGPKGAAKRAAAAAKADDDSAAAPTAKAPDADASKEDAASDGDKRDKGSEGDAPAKPQSAGASTRDAATKVLNLALKGEWTPVEQTLKALEKSIANAGEDANTTPLAGVMDPVSKFQIIKKLSATKNEKTT